MLPINLEGQSAGLLAIGSFNEQRFRAGMGTSYLGHLSAYLSAILQKMLSQK
jgi:uncharacterized protein YigA (DUF484 family)